MNVAIERERLGTLSTLLFCFGVVAVSSTPLDAQIAYAEPSFVNLVNQNLQVMGYRGDASECLALRNDYMICKSQSSAWHMRLYRSPLKFCLLKNSN